MNNIPITTPARALAWQYGQRGVALLEILGALAIGAILVVSLASMMDTSLEDVKGQQAAYYQSEVVAAGKKYIAANIATLQSATAVVTVSVTQLKNGKFLSESTGLKNVYGQTACVLIRPPNPASPPGQFDALVATSGGEDIPDGVIAMIAANSGPGGGYISKLSPGTGFAKGASWSASTVPFRGVQCGGGAPLTGGPDDAGHLASNLFHGGPGDQRADFLYRNAIAGQAELNSMRTPIRMAEGALVEIGKPCKNGAGVSEAGIAIEATTRELVVCGTSDVWTAMSQWKAPAPTFASLPSDGSIRGDVRMTTDDLRAFTFNGVSWEAIAVDQDGNMKVPGTLTAANAHTTGNIVADGTIRAVGDISTSGTVAATLDVTASRNIKAARDITAAHNVVTEGLQVNRWTSSPAFTVGIATFVPGAACHYAEFDPWEGTTHITFPMGTVVMDANYVPLICGLDKTMRYANGTYTP